MSVVSYGLAEEQRQQLADERFLKKLAKRYELQVNRFYSRSQPLREKDRKAFSPSLASKCARELYHLRSGAQEDAAYQIPWQARVPRNGTGCHEVTQRDLLLMPKVMDNVSFRVKTLENGKPALEVSGAKVFDVDDQIIEIAGSCDAIMEYWENGEYRFDLIWEKKTRTRLSGLSEYAINRTQESSHKYQATAYSLLFGLDIVLFEYESLEKPPWGKGENAPSDLAIRAIRVTEQMRRDLLLKFALVERSLEDKTPPPRETDKCVFCRFTQACGGDAA